MVEINRQPDPSLPGLTPKAGASSSKTQAFGEQAEAFYSWYQSIRQIGFPQQGYHALQAIMAISEQGTATQDETKSASQKISNLIDDIDGGCKTLDQIPQELEMILDGLTQHNPKSRLVKQITQIQININLSDQISSWNFQAAMEQILTKVITDFPTIHAEAMSRLLQEAIDEPQGFENLEEKILKFLK